MASFSALGLAGGETPEERRRRLLRERNSSLGLAEASREGIGTRTDAQVIGPTGPNPFDTGPDSPSGGADLVTKPTNITDAVGRVDPSRGPGIAGSVADVLSRGSTGGSGGQSFEDILKDFISRESEIDPSAFGPSDNLTSLRNILVSEGLFEQGQKAPQAADVGQITAPELATPEERQQFRDQQQTLIDQLLAASRGEGTSAAQLQLEAGRDAAIRQAQALAASQPGVSPALAARLAQQQGGIATREAAQQAAILRAKEQLAARALAGTTLQQARGQDVLTRGQDIDVARERARLGLDADVSNQGIQRDIALANLDAALQDEQTRNKFLIDTLGLATDIDKFGTLSSQDLERLRLEEFLGKIGSARVGATGELAAQAQADADRRALERAVAAGGIAAIGNIGASFLGGR